MPSAKPSGGGTADTRSRTMQLGRRCNLAAMSQERTEAAGYAERLADELRERVERERAAGAYADDLSGVELEVPGEGAPIVEGFDLEAVGPRVRFRPELGFSAKPVVGPVITLVKKSILRLLFYVLDDLARQTDTAIRRVESALAVEVATRERLEGQVGELEARIARLEAAETTRRRRV
jgi:hypothetical protein